MEKAFLDTYNKVLEELDFRIEAKNAEKGKDTYKGDPVNSVGVNQDIPAMKDAMVLEKAEGVPLDRYIQDVKKDFMRQFGNCMEPFKVIRRGGAMDPGLNAENMKAYEETRKRLVDLMDKVVDKQRMVTKVAEQWIYEACYGNLFYHGDMHSGNLMVGENNVTVLDYGNATTLEKNERDLILAMTSCFVGKSNALAPDFRIKRVKNSSL